MSYLLDTCVISELINPKPNRSVIEWLDGCDEREFFLSVLTIGELEKGIAKLPESKRKKRFRAWVDGALLRRFSGRILTIDMPTATLWGTIQGLAEREGRPIPTIDGLLGASARSMKLVLVTRNTNDMVRTGAEIFNPWEYEHYGSS